MTIRNWMYTFDSSFITLFSVTSPVGSGFILNGFLHDLAFIPFCIGIQIIVTGISKILHIPIL